MAEAKTGELLPAPDRGSSAREGEYVPAGEGIGSVLDPHSTEAAADNFRGAAKNVDLEKVDESWVMARLVREATDFGTRTRQSSRVKALELIGRQLGMFDPAAPDDDTPEEKRARSMLPEDRMRRIAALAKKLGKELSG